jgi:hypothetical protein
VFSRLGLRLEGSKEFTCLVSNKCPEFSDSKPLSDAAALQTVLVTTKSLSEMSEDVLHHKVEHMRNHQAILLDKITVGSAMQSHEDIRTRIHDETS